MWIPLRITTGTGTAINIPTKIKRITKTATGIKPEIIALKTTWIGYLVERDSEPSSFSTSRLLPSRD
jgi:hypothetical protein